MPIPSGSRALAVAQSGFKRDFGEAMREVSDQVGAIVLREAGDDQQVSAQEARRIARRSGELVERVFVGSDGRSAFADDGVTPLSPYARILNKWIVYVTVQAVNRQRDWMKRTIPEDVFNWLAGASAPQRTVREMVEDHLRAGYVSTAVKNYHLNHHYKRNDDLLLDDRIWRAGADTRKQLDTTVATMIRSGESALSISRRAEQFLLPGRAALRTNKPYGTDASYYGMRLGRTEITFAAGQSTLIAASLNPYVEGIKWNLSPSHPRTDICDGNAAGSPYAVDNVPTYPAHPFCMCNLTVVSVKNPSFVTDQLRPHMEAGEDAPLTPASADNLLLMLLGLYLFSLARRVALA